MQQLVQVWEQAKDSLDVIVQNIVQPTFANVKKIKSFVIQSVTIVCHVKTNNVYLCNFNYYCFIEQHDMSFIIVLYF